MKSSPASPTVSGKAPGVRGDHGHPGRHRFQNGNAESFVPGRHDEQVGSGITGMKPFVTHLPEKMHAVFHAKIPPQRPALGGFDAVGVLGISGHYQVNRRRAPASFASASTSTGRRLFGARGPQTEEALHRQDPIPRRRRKETSSWCSPGFGKMRQHIGSGCRVSAQLPQFLGREQTVDQHAIRPGEASPARTLQQALPVVKSPQRKRGDAVIIEQYAWFSARQEWQDLEGREIVSEFYQNKVGVGHVEECRVFGIEGSELAGPIL